MSMLTMHGEAVQLNVLIQSLFFTYRCLIVIASCLSLTSKICGMRQSSVIAIQAIIGPKQSTYIYNASDLM
jgi:hypothetical protein